MQTIGERLEDARKRKGLSIREAAEATKIRGDYLQKFEGNQFNIGLTDIYVRGFLRNYANFLHVPGDRIVNDYNALSQGEAKPRAPSREVYGRMEVGVSGAAADARSGRRAPEAGGPGPGAQPDAAPPATGESTRPSLRPHAASLPPAARIDPSLVFKILLGGAGLIMVLLIVWLLKSLLAGSSASHRADHPALTAEPPAAAAEGDASFALVASQPVSVRVLAADGHELWSGQLTAGERHEIPNVGARISASAIEALEIDFKGSHFRFGAGARGQRTVDVPALRVNAQGQLY